MGKPGITRRDFLAGAVAGGMLGLGGAATLRRLRRPRADVLIARAGHYGVDLGDLIFRGMMELGLSERELSGTRILLKPNLVETRPGAVHINTHPLVVQGAAEAFRRLGAGEVMVGEGAGHVRDSLLLLEESGLGEVLQQERLSFRDLNSDPLFTVPNVGRFLRLKTLTFPAALREVDWVVSLAKMKTHHWAGVTLSMKNLFGLMPGSVYGWPKNVLHFHGIQSSILDINATVKPHFAIVDGIVGMEGDGPIMGSPKEAGVLVMGCNPTAVDATCCRIMGIDPMKVGYIKAAGEFLGAVERESISQVGEIVEVVEHSFQLLSEIPAHRVLL